MMEYSNYEKMQINIDIKWWKNNIGSSNLYGKLEDRKSYLRESSISPTIRNSIFEKVNSNNIWTTIPLRNSNVNPIITVFDDKETKIFDGMYLNLKYPKLLTIKPRDNWPRTYFLYVEDYDLLETYDPYKIIKPERTDPRIITSYVTDSLNLNYENMATIFSLPSLGSPIYKELLPGINMGLDIFGLSDFNKERLAYLLTLLIPIEFHSDLPLELLKGRKIKLLNGVKFRLSENIYNDFFTISSNKINSRNLSSIANRNVEKETSIVLFGNIPEPKLFDIIFATLNLPCYYSAYEYEISGLRDIRRIYPDEEVQHNVIARHFINPVINNENELYSYFSDELESIFKDYLMRSEEELDALSTTKGGRIFLQNIYQATLSKARLDKKETADINDLRPIVKNLEDSITGLVTNNVNIEKFLKSEKKLSKKRLDKPSIEKMSLIKDFLIASPDITSEQLYDYVKNGFDSFDDFLGFLEWLHNKGFIMENRGRYKWIGL